MAYFTLHILEYYDENGPLRFFGFSDALIARLARPYIILLVVYGLALALPIYFVTKKRFQSSTYVSGAMLLIYTLIPPLLKLLLDQP